MRRMLVLVVALVVMLVASACQPPVTVTYAGPKGATRVAVVGDSITAWSDAAVKKGLSTYQVAVAATPGINLADGRKQLVGPVVATNPDVLVIELGINSVGPLWSSKDLPHLEGVLSDVDHLACVIWVTPTAYDPSWFDHNGPGTLNHRLLSVKNSIKKRLPAHPNVHLADWGVIEQTHIEWYKDDHLHLSAKGQTAYGKYLAEQVDTLC